MRILQVCNVGEICGGTAACAWSITHALADHEHIVNFLSSPSAETKRAFRHCQVEQFSTVTKQELDQWQPDLVILHNTPPERISGHEQLLCVQYHHSVGKRAVATIHVACSKYLQRQLPQDTELLYQPVPIPPEDDLRSIRQFRDRLTIGRICTPNTRKWPQQLIPFYETLSERFPNVQWEFVGAPEEIKQSVAHACRQRCRFFSAEFAARKYYWQWDALLYHHPSLAETFGRTVAEAMRAGCIPIVDARGGFLEQFEQQQAGFACKDVEEFSVAMTALLNEDHRHELSQNAMIHANQQFSLESFYQRFRQLTQKIGTQ